jgi:hypothetical protein
MLYSIYIRRSTTTTVFGQFRPIVFFEGIDASKNTAVRQYHFEQVDWIPHNVIVDEHDVGGGRVSHGTGNQIVAGPSHQTVILTKFELNRKIMGPKQFHRGQHGTNVIHITDSSKTRRKNIEFWMLSFDEIRHLFENSSRFVFGRIRHRVFFHDVIYVVCLSIRF